MRRRLKQVRSELGRDYPVIINGEKITIRRRNLKASIRRTKRKSSAYFPTPMRTRKIWSNKRLTRRPTPLNSGKTSRPKNAPNIFSKRRQIIRERKHYFSAWMVFEVGKTWAEADGDTAEAIDFLRILRARNAALGAANSRSRQNRRRR